MVAFDCRTDRDQGGRLAQCGFGVVEAVRLGRAGRRWSITTAPTSRSERIDGATLLTPARLDVTALETARLPRYHSSVARIGLCLGHGYLGMTQAATLPLFHLYGDPPDDQAFDFIHIETIASRSSIHDWTIRAHRHRNLFQILLIERGGGEMTFEAATLAFRRARRHPGAGRRSRTAFASSRTSPTAGW